MSITLSRRRLSLAAVLVTGMTLGAPPLPILASHGGLHAVISTPTTSGPEYSQQRDVVPGDEFGLIVKADADFGRTQVSLGNLPLAGTITLIGDGPWNLAKLSPDSPTPIDALEFDTSQSDAVQLNVRVRDDATPGVYGLLDARIRVQTPVAAAGAPSGSVVTPPTTAPMRQVRPGDPQSNATSAPPPDVVLVDTPLSPGWLMVQCYCWRGEGVPLPEINLRESRGDWSYSFTPDLGKPVVFTDLPTDVAMTVELAEKSGALPGQPTRWNDIYLASRGAVIYFVVGPS